MADHFIASLQWRTDKTIIRVEPYYKRYRHLPLSTADGYAADGHGMSRGIDFFLEDMSVLLSFVRCCLIPTMIPVVGI